MRITLLLPLLAALPAAASTVLDSFDTQTIATSTGYTASLVAGHLGNAVQLDWQNGSLSDFAADNGVHGSAAWDTAAGLSLWVKGDGSTHCGVLEFIWNGDYAQRYAAAFPITDTTWHQVMIPWSDLCPESSNPVNQPLGSARAPSLIDQMWFGKWWYWRDVAACTYTVDDLRLETSITVDATNYKPTGAALARAHAKLMAGLPLQLVTMGDSLTDLQHSSNTSHNWPTYLVDGAQANHGCAITLVDPAIGGTELRGNVVMIPHWLQTAPQPDLVTIFFGGNDYAAGMTSPTFHDAIVDAIRRIRRLTAGHADIMVMTTCPGVANWTTYTALVNDAKLAASQENAGLCDIDALFHATASSGSAASSLYVSDGTHLSAAGQQLVATAVLQAIEATGAGTTTGGTTTGGTTTGGTTTSGTTTSGTTTSGTTSAGTTTSGTTSAGTTTTAGGGSSGSGSSHKSCGAGAAGGIAGVGLVLLFGGRRRPRR